MKVLFISRRSAGTQPGGDVNQLLKTMNAMKVARPAWSFNTLSISDFLSKPENNSCFDIIVCHNICRPADIIKVSNFSSAKLVVSSIYVDFEELLAVTQNKILKLFYWCNASDILEYLKIIIKGVLGKESFPPALFLRQSYKNSIRTVIDRADLVLVNSINERSRLFSDLNYSEESILTLTNKFFQFCPGTSLNQESKITEVFRENRDIDVISVGRIDEGKGQLHLVKELSNTGLKVVIVGGPLHSKYAQKCIEISGDNVEFTGVLDSTAIQSLLQRSKVHVLNSAFEVFGLVTLDALICGCRTICTNRGDQVEHFGSISTVVDRDDPNIIGKIYDTMESGSQTLNVDWEKTFSWRNAAESICTKVEELCDE